jgi:2-dehydro-3-deoxyphosphogluconate aldolase/(4S)-4-hydroxy-2-oxoglutarate aldolase
MNPQQTAFVRQAMGLSAVIPVLVIERTDDALPLARALLHGGLKVLEITLRTPNALEVIGLLARELPEALIAAGTITTPDQWEAATKAGARLGVSPGLSPALIEASASMAMPLLPGVATASELMTAMDAGFECFKFFPAQQAGGIGMLKAFGGPFAQALFCPTGGITVETAPDFLALPNVACVGGSWMAPAKALQAGDWVAIETLARQAAALSRPAP